MPQRQHRHRPELDAHKRQLCETLWAHFLSAAGPCRLPAIFTSHKHLGEPFHLVSVAGRPGDSGPSAGLARLGLLPRCAFKRLI